MELRLRTSWWLRRGAREYGVNLTRLKPRQATAMRKHSRNACGGLRKTVAPSFRPRQESARHSTTRLAVLTTSSIANLHRDVRAMTRPTQ